LAGWLAQAYPSPLNYYKFPRSVCTSVNEVICHGIPDCRPLEDGDIVNIDVSTYFNDCHGDLNETFMVSARLTTSMLTTGCTCAQARRLELPHVF
jgi:methionyl aminopeptidase